jgi:alkylation response protein AidB-like acyl-CoA dehydrogenase
MRLYSYNDDSAAVCLSIAGIQGMMYPSEYGGGGAKDIFYEVIACDEFARMGGG